MTRTRQFRRLHLRALALTLKLGGQLTAEQLRASDDLCRRYIIESRR